MEEEGGASTLSLARAIDQNVQELLAEIDRLRKQLALKEEENRTVYGKYNEVLRQKGQNRKRGKTNA